MKSVLISIQPYWVFLIIAKIMGWEINQEKTVEVRKTCPKDLDWNKKAIIYCSKNKQSFNLIPKKYQPLMEKFLGKVTGHFVCNRIDYIGWISTPAKLDWKNYYDEKSCLTSSQLYDYSDGGCYYEWHISDLVIYDKPKELREFYTLCEKIPSEIACRGCINNQNEFCQIKHKPLTRPPQSWCYVEE